MRTKDWFSRHDTVNIQSKYVTATYDLSMVERLKLNIIYGTELQYINILTSWHIFLHTFLRVWICIHTCILVSTDLHSNLLVPMNATRRGSRVRTIPHLELPFQNIASCWSTLTNLAVMHGMNIVCFKFSAGIFKLMPLHWQSRVKKIFFARNLAHTRSIQITGFH